ncbi:MAG: pitrilysin family protein [Chloroherpetonaceae bacterium]|nr:insulinase family protein [Chloroherpetonaceae bacterium]MCS7210518.1 insulinase family protein [Chloroherpetonaceae bacterium]MDW8018617.1 pitrilysin family protein [Chloroherpetonaceae bacterium]
MHKAKLVSSSPLQALPSTAEMTTLPNGLTVITETVKTVRSVSVGLWVGTGSRDESAELNGISHFIEHMVFKGTKKRDYIEISKSLERVGGYLNAYTSKEQTCFYARVLDEYVRVAVDVLADLVFNPTFPDEELEKEKDVIIEEIKSIEDTPDELISDEFDELFYPNHPLGLPIAGTPKTVRAFTRAAVQEYLSEAYTTNKMLLVAAGNVSHKAMLALAEKYIPKRRQGNGRLRQAYLHETYRPFVKEKVKPISQAHIMLGFPMARNDETYYAAHLLNMVLGGGMSSRLNLELREKQGLAYTVFSSLHHYDETNMLSIYMGTDYEKVSQSIQSIRRELDKLTEKTVPAKELELAKAQLKGGVIMAQESMSSRISHIARDMYYFGRILSSDEIIERIDAVMPKDLRAVAETVFDERLGSMLTYLPKKRK